MSQWRSKTYVECCENSLSKTQIGNIALKVRSCLQKLQDSNKSSEQLAEVNKTTHSSNKTDFVRDEPSQQGLQQKKLAFSDSENNLIRKRISKYGYG